jgi:peptide/nickel transport system permease protein
MRDPSAATGAPPSAHARLDGAGPPVEARLAGRRRLVLRQVTRSPVGLAGMAIMWVVILTAALAPSIVLHDPTRPNLAARFQPPGWAEDSSWTYPLGTDQLGRDILSRLIMGSRVSVIVGVASVAISSLTGVTLGLVSGYYPGAWDQLLMRITDAFLAIPFLVLVVAVAGVVGPGLLTIILILGFTGWVTYSRVIRGEVLALREQEYITAARALGQRDSVILFKHVLPNVSASIIVIATLQVATTILAESSLSFLGLGVQPPTVTWGAMLADGRQHMGGAWWLATFPGLAITITVLGIVFLGDWLRDVLDPKLRE